MSLNKNLVADFVKATKNDKKDNKEKIVYGKISKYDENANQYYVKIDGSNSETPVLRFTTTVDLDEKVIVMIKNHSAIITGNISSVAVNENHVTKQLKTLNTVAKESQIRALWDE